jgi:hypothetical protein
MERKGIQIVKRNPRCFISPHFVEQLRRKGAKRMPQREKLTDVVADRDELLDKVEELRDLADDIISEYETDEPEDEDDSDSGDGD